MVEGRNGESDLKKRLTDLPGREDGTLVVTRKKARGKKICFTPPT